MSLKNFIKKVLISTKLDITKNLKYDRLTQIIIKKYIKQDYNCIDIGCHKGEILDLIIKYAPKGFHYAFEPLPFLFNNLKNKYGDKVKIFPYALSSENRTSSFQYVKNAPAYSGINKRRYDIKNPEIEEITVELKKLDELIPINEKIHFIKIDVEGGEFDVLRGSKELLRINNPLILFEFGKGASDYYGTSPSELYDFLVNELNFKIYTLESYIKNNSSITEAKFENYFDDNSEYYFVAKK